MTTILWLPGSQKAPVTSQERSQEGQEAPEWVGLATPATPAADSASCFQLGTAPQLLDAVAFIFRVCTSGLSSWGPRWVS